VNYNRHKNGRKSEGFVILTPFDKSDYDSPQEETASRRDFWMNGMEQLFKHRRSVQKFTAQPVLPKRPCRLWRRKCGRKKRRSWRKHFVPNAIPRTPAEQKM